MQPSLYRHARRVSLSVHYDVLSIVVALTLIAAEMSVSSAQSIQDPYVTSLASASQCVYANSMSMDSNLAMFIGCADGIKLINGSSLTQVGNSTVLFQYANDLFYDEGTRWLYVASQSGGLFRWSMDTQTFQFVLTVSQCKYPKRITPTYFGGTAILVACLDTGVFRVELANLTASTLVNTTECSGPLGVITYAEFDSVFVAVPCRDTGIIRKNLNTQELDLLASPDICDSPTAVTRDHLGRILASCRDTGVLQFTGTEMQLLPINDECSSAYLVWSLPQFGFSLVDCQFTGVTAIVDYNNETLAISIATHDFCDTARNVQVYDGAIYLICFNSGAIKLSSKSVSALTTYAQCRSPNGLAVDHTSGALVASCSNGVVVISGKLVHMIANSSVCNNAFALGWPQPEISDRIVVSCVSRQTLESVNASTLAVMVDLTGTICDSVTGFLLDSNSNQMYISCSLQDYSIVSVDLTTQVMRPIVPTTQCDTAPGLYLDKNTGLLYAACFDFGILAIGSSGTITTVVNGTVCSIASAVLIHNDHLFFACTQGLLRANLDGSNVRILVDSTQCLGANAIYVDSTTGNILVTCVTVGGVWVVDGVTGVASQLLTPTQCPSAITVFSDPNTRITFAACSSRAIVAVTTDFRCSSGTTWSVGSCIPCDPHKFRSSDDLRPLGPCSSCPPGYVAPQYGSTSCTPCAAGSYDSNKNCLLCPVGKYQPLPGMTECMECPAGSYSIIPGSTGCALCEAGFYSAVNGSASCLPCDRGSASSVIGSIHPCPGCPAGSYQNGVGKTVCITCEPHTYAERDNSTSCTRCANQVNEAHTSCTLVTCEPNSEFDDMSNECQLCPLSQYSSRGGLCTVCTQNTYTPGVGSGCAPCTGEGLVCFGGVAQVTPGHWAYVSDSEDFTWTDPANPLGPSYQLFQTAPCPFCPGTKLQLLQVVNTSQLVNSTSPDDSLIQYCAFPRLNSVNNTLCANCADGYLAWGDTCVVCNSANGSLIFGYLVFSFALVLFLFYSSTNSSSAGTTAMFLFFIQTAALEIGSIVRYIDWIQVANLDAKATASCLAPWSAYGQTLFSLLIPVLLIAELLIIALIHYGLHKMVSKSSSGNDESTPSNDSKAVRFIMVRLRRFSLDDYATGILSILLFCYTCVATASLRYLHCVNVRHERLNFNAPTIDCHSSEYKAYLAPVLMTVIGYVIGFPLISLVKLWRNREYLYAPTTEDSSSSKAGSNLRSPAVQSFLHHWAPFYSPYASHAWFWQCGILFRRAAFVVTAVLLMQEPSQQFMVFTFLHFASLLVHLYIKPYESEKLNHQETISYVLLVSISLLLTGYLPPYPLLIQLFLFFLVVPPAICMFGVILLQRYQVWRDCQHLAKLNSPAANVDVGSTWQNGSAPGVLEPSATAVEMPSMTPAAPNNLDSTVAESILPAYALDSEQERL